MLSEIYEQNLILEKGGKELCQNKEDVLNSDTVKRIIKFILSYGNNNIYNNDSVNQDINVIYKKIVDNEPITLNERNNLIAFLNDAENKNIAQSIMSKLFILQGDNNGEFINSFLRDSEGKMNINKFINYVIDKLNYYSIIVKTNDGKSILEISNKSEENDSIKIYVYNELNENEKENKSNKRIFGVYNGKKIDLNTNFIINPIVLDDGLIYGINSENKRVLYGFDGDKFIEIELSIENGFLDIEKTPEKGYFKINTPNGFLLKKICKENGKWLIYDSLVDFYDNFSFQNGFIITKKGNENCIFILNGDNLERSLNNEIIAEKIEFLKINDDLYVIRENNKNLTLLQLDNNNRLNKVNKIKLGNFEYICIDGIITVVEKKEEKIVFLYLYDFKNNKFHEIKNFSSYNKISNGSEGEDLEKCEINNIFSKAILVDFNDGSQGIYVFDKNNGKIIEIIKIDSNEIKLFIENSTDEVVIYLGRNKYAINLELSYIKGKLYKNPYNILWYLKIKRIVLNHLPFSKKT